MAPSRAPDALDNENSSKPHAWVIARDAAVDAAIAGHDEDALAKISAQPGGFGSQSSRRKAWVELLHVDRLARSNGHDVREPTPDTDTEGVRVFPPHDDEGQVGLDTRRSFVTYPKGLSDSDKAAMQEDLHALIVSVLQRHPKLSYFQGLHDIMTVLYLTLLTEIPRPRPHIESHSDDDEETVQDEKKPLKVKGKVMTPEDRLEWGELVRAAEVVTLCRTRDAMGKGLGPMMGMLRLLRRLLAAADPQLYRISASISPVPTLPFFALSWILTLFSHDIDTLEPVQRIFDYLIARNPISAIYLAVAILMSKKPQMLKLARDLGPEVTHDPSLLHPLFARLPPLYPDTPDSPFPPPDFTAGEPAPRDEPNPYTPINLSTVFTLADGLFVKYPWDGPRIRGQEVFGAGSVVSTFDKEPRARPRGGQNEQVTREKDEWDEKDGLHADAWTLSDAEAAIDNEVILPGGDAMDDDEVLTVARWSPLTPLSAFVGRVGLGLSSGGKGGMGVYGFDRLGTAVAVGIVVLGIGAALFGWRRHTDPSWARFWGLVAGQWVVKSRAAMSPGVEGVARGWNTVGRYIGRTLRDVL